MSPIVAAVGILYAIPFAVRAWRRRRGTAASIVAAIERLTGEAVAWAPDVDQTGRACVVLPAVDPVLAALTLRDSGVVDNLVELVVADPTTATLILCPRTSGPRGPTTWAVVEHGETVLL